MGKYFMTIIANKFSIVMMTYRIITARQASASALLSILPGLDIGGIIFVFPR